MRTSWNLGKFFYSSPDDPRIAKDVAVMKRAYDAFSKKYSRDTSFTTNAGKLLAALVAYEKLLNIVGPAKPFLYVNYVKELDAENSVARAKLSALIQEMAPYENKIIFFSLRLGKISAVNQKKFLEDKRLAKYRYMLSKIFETARYDLSEAEEKILNLKSQPSHSLWVEGVEKVVNKQTVRFGAKDIPINEAIGLVASLPTQKKRVALQRAIMEKLKIAGDFAESEMNAIVLNKKVSDDLRGFKNPWSATILNYQNSEDAILNLIGTVTRAFPISHRFYTLKKKLLGLPTMTYADRSASLGRTKRKIPFPEAVKRYDAVLEGIDRDYAKIFRRFLADGHVDVYPKVGKSGGAYCSSNLGSPTLVLLNHTDDFRSFMTLAHEMGHAIHAEMSKTQPPIYQGHTISVAETASTLFEQLTFESIFETLSPKEQTVVLHDKINDDVSTIFRQIAFFNFEKDLHASVRSRGALSKKEMAALLSSHMKAYLGPAVSLDPSDGWFFIAVSHFRRFFYVYAYAYGQLVSKALVEEYKKDHSFGKRIRKFLEAGESKNPEQIFADMGIDTASPALFAKGLKSIERDIDRLEQLAKQR